MKMIFAPEVDMLVVSKSSRNQRKSIMNFVPRIGLTTVDYGRLQEIDNFYLDCQNFRDYYRDPYNKLPRPLAFKKHYGKCGNRYVDKSIEQFMLPTRWVTESQPPLYPLNNHRHIVSLNEGIHLGGVYNADPCVKYKH